MHFPRGRTAGPEVVPLNRNLLSGLAIGVFAGFLIGYFVGSGRANDDAPAVPAPVAATAAPRPNPMEYQERIAANQKIVDADPKNEKVWIALGNDYFDLQQAQSAVDAYAKALALSPNNPDVLTDQGVMYRQLGLFDQALANFQKAGKLNPKHLQSFFNLGIVYSQDKKNPEAAAKAWAKVIEIDPNSPQGLQAQQFLAAQKQQPKP
jgi:tetratricopeptide (TPR) repeat protein